jgi:hypothetical protein
MEKIVDKSHTAKVKYTYTMLTEKKFMLLKLLEKK